MSLIDVLYVALYICVDSVLLYFLFNVFNVFNFFLMGHEAN